MLFSIKEGLKSFTINPVQTIFSILGIVIGVAALVSILALGDGLETYSRKQLQQTTDIQKIGVITKNRVFQNGITFRNEQAPIFSIDDKNDLKKRLPESTKLRFYFNHAFQVAQVNDSLQLGAYLTAFETFSEINKPLKNGVNPDSSVAAKLTGVWITSALKTQFSISDFPIDSIAIGGKFFPVFGVISDSAQQRIYQYAAAISDSLRHVDPPMFILEVADLEEVNKVKEDINTWKHNRFGAADRFVEIQSYEARLAQAEQAAALFKLIMGLITGISVLVGGIGVMNVLLMSIKDRTPEIGIRKSVGATRLHIGIQFLSESVAISSLGSLLGFLLSFTFMTITIPLIKHYQNIDFPVDWSLGTLVVVGIVAVLVGIFFGTYPAIKASRLNPIDAIQRV